MLLPMIPGSKEMFFGANLLVYNETFTGLKPKKSNITRPSFCVVWNSTTMTRKADDVASTFMKVIADYSAFV